MNVGGTARTLESSKKNSPMTNQKESRLNSSGNFFLESNFAFIFKRIEPPEKMLCHRTYVSVSSRDYVSPETVFVGKIKYYLAP
jgi:hypothetical protein